MAELEENMLIWTTDRPYMWWRYIDDIFAIWEFGQERLDNFLQQINLFHPTIKFVAEHSTEKVTFLDTTVILEGRTIHTDLYTKPTDTHQYLSPESCHPRHCTTSIPYSQSLRLKRICSRNEDFQERTNELKQHLMARGYGELAVEQQIRRAASVPRVESLQPHPRRQPQKRVPLVVTYHPSLANLARVARKHLPMLHTSQRLRRAIPEPPLIAFRRPRNLRDLLVRARSQGHTTPHLHMLMQATPHATPDAANVAQK